MLSVIVPCFNEEDVIAQTHTRLAATLRSLGCDFEILYVDDGSSDRTPELLSRLADGDRSVRVLRLSRNFGHQVAVSAGIDHASGQAVALIDADLQDPPELIADMVREWRAGYHVVYGRRGKRHGETRFKTATASCFYRFLGALSEVRIPHDTGDFRLMDRKVVDALRALPERDRYVRGLIAWVGFRQKALLYDRDARAAGVSKYPLKKMVKLARDALVSFSLKPLQLPYWLGGASLAVALGAAAWGILGRLLNGEDPSTVLWIVAVVAAFQGLQFFTIGILGEYIGRSYGEAKRRPLYVVMETQGFDVAEPRALPRVS
jgi:dolichol-phosphate mannosyltransferase